MLAEIVFSKPINRTDWWRRTLYSSRADNLSLNNTLVVRKLVQSPEVGSANNYSYCELSTNTVRNQLVCTHTAR
jgi:hypothetical protein